MSDGIYIPWWGWLALIAALLVCAIVIKFGLSLFGVGGSVRW